MNPVWSDSMDQTNNDTKSVWVGKKFYAIVNCLKNLFLQTSPRLFVGTSPNFAQIIFRQRGPKIIESFLKDGNK